MAKLQIRYGSQGADVKELQKALNQNGYKLNEDGIFGANTLKAVKDYQQKNKLSVDGIVGNQTWNAVLGLGGTTNKTPTTPKEDTGFKYDDFSYDDFTYNNYNESDTVKDAEAALNAQLAQKPGEYQSQWQAQLNDTINKILNREKFSYDLNGDALYQQYKDKYIQQGKMAMGDAIGQASAMTGGYGNSYAQSVGQQAYQAQLQNLNDIVPELYQMAYDKYNQEGQDLYNQYSMLGNQENQDYGRYRDTVSDWQTERNYLADRYDSERTFDYSKYTDDRNFTYGKYADDRNFAYGKYGDDKKYAYQDYADKIAQEQWQTEFDKANEQWQAEFDEAKRQFDEKMAFSREQYNDSNDTSDYSYAGKSTSPNVISSGSNNSKVNKVLGVEGGSGNSYDNGGLSNTQVKALQDALGVDADGKYGSASMKAAGGLSAEEAYKKFVLKEFTGATYADAVTFMTKNGVPKDAASGAMTQSEWRRRKSAYNSSGQGGSEVANYSSYTEYLKDFVAYQIEQYGG